MWILFIIIFILYLINNKEGFSDEQVNRVKYIIVTKYHDHIEPIIKDYKKHIKNEIIIIADDEFELEKIKKMGYSGEILNEKDELLITQYFVKKYAQSVLYIDKNIEILSSNINDDISKYISDKNVDIVLRCNSKDFLNKCDNEVSTSFMLMKPSLLMDNYNNEDIMSYLNNNKDINWVVFNSYYYPNRDRYYNNIRSVYYNNNPYIKNKE